MPSTAPPIQRTNTDSESPSSAQNPTGNLNDLLFARLRFPDRLESIRSIDEHFIGTTLLEATSYQPPKDKNGNHYINFRGLIVSKLPSGENALFYSIYEYADSMLPAQNKNYFSPGQPVNLASTDFKLKAFVRLDPKAFGIDETNLVNYQNLSAKQRNNDILKNIPASYQHLKPQHLYKEDGVRPTIRFAYGGWDGPGDPGGSDAVYSLDSYGVTQQLKHTIPATQEAAKRVQQILGSSFYDVHAYSHSISAAHTNLLAALKGTDAMSRILPGAKEFRLQELEPVGGAGAAAKISREIAAAVYPQDKPSTGAVKVAKRITENVHSLVSRSDPRTSAWGNRPSLLRTYLPDFDPKASAATGNDITCLLFDVGSANWNYRALDPWLIGYIMDFARHVPDFIKGVDLHWLGRMGSRIKTKGTTVSHAENPSLCPEAPIPPEELATLGTKPSQHTANDDYWQGMLRAFQRFYIIPSANKKLGTDENGHQLARPHINDAPSPFPHILEQLGRPDLARQKTPAR